MTIYSNAMDLAGGRDLRQRLPCSVNKLEYMVMVLEYSRLTLILWAIGSLSRNPDLLTEFTRGKLGCHVDRCMRGVSCPHNSAWLIGRDYINR